MTATAEAGLVLASPRGRWVVLTTVLGSGVAMLDATVVSVALPRIGDDLGAGLTSLQWTVNAYTLTLAGFLLLGGSLGDRLGRRKVFLIGVVWFAAASAGCALAPNAGVLIVMRALQGFGAALLTPGSLAIIEASFTPDDRGAAVGAWSGLGGVAAALGPVLGGLLVSAAPWGWRLAFLINVPLAVLIVAVALRHVPETRDRSASGRLDLRGAVLAAVGLAGIVYALTDGPPEGWPPMTVAALVGGGVALLAFVSVESRTAHPLLPFSLFRSGLFTAANLVTLVVYAALGGAFFLLPLQLQRGSGYLPLAAGAALLPTTLVMLLLSARMGRLAQQLGPRVPMTVGPLLQACGLVLLTRVGVQANYLTDVLPGVLVLALGLAVTVAPLTSTVLAAAPEEQAGVASAVNNAVARVAALLAVAVLPGLVGLDQEAYVDPLALSAGVQVGMLVVASLCAAGGALAWFTVRVAPVSGAVRHEHMHCPISAPPLATRSHLAR
jgi:EmrB/QacA subfamily drug resistance transporter